VDKRVLEMCREIDKQKLATAQEGVTAWAEKLLDENAALREQLKYCSAVVDRQQEMLDRNTEQIAVLCNLLSEAEHHKVVAVAKTDWITEELVDGDKICAALGLERTEGGRFPVPKILSAIRERQHGITKDCWCRPTQDTQVPNLWIHKKEEKKPWIGLTNEDKNNCLVSADPCESLSDPEAQQLMKDVEAKLKDKNGE